MHKVADKTVRCSVVVKNIFRKVGEEEAAKFISDTILVTSDGRGFSFCDLDC